jgi:hypothetical protein
MTGFVVFFASAAISGACVLLHATRARYIHGRTVASVAKEAAVTGGFLAAYVAVCLLLGYGLLPQLLGCLAGGVVLWFGRRWVPALNYHLGRQSDA